MSQETQDKQARLCRGLRALRGAVVAFSGGVDSSFLLAVAHEALGPRVLAVTARSPSFPRRENEESIAVARQIGARQIFFDSDEFEDPEYRRNPPERCYHCKLALFRKLQEIARQEGLETVIEGSNRDDAGDYRPGRRAIAELGVRSPLAEVGLTKAEIRALSRARGLPTWDKPARACLASRIPYGQELTPAGLRRVESAEEILRGLGIAHMRVRDHGPVARIEVGPEDLARLTAPDARERIVSQFKALGYRFVALDLEGYRTGSLNDMLDGAADPPNGASPE